MRLLPTSVRTRLTLWYAVALALPLVAFAVASYLIFADTVRSRTDAFIGDAMTVFARELRSERRMGPDTRAVIRRTLSEVRFREVDIVVLDSADKLVGTSRGAVPPTDDPVRLLTTSPAAPGIATVAVRGHVFRVVTRPLEAGGQQFLMAGVHDLADVEAMLRRIRRLFLITIPLIIAAAAAGAFFLTRRSLRPVSAMAAQAAAIGASTLHERLPVATRDELGQLAGVLNDLLDRLERSFEQQRRFMTDASHELRTPTAIVRSEADVTLSRPSRQEDEYRASMAVVQDAARRLTRIVDDVFLIARADAGHVVMVPERLYLDDLVRDTARAVRPIADARAVTVALGGVAEAPVLGDPDLLDRLILNLLDNAIKHSPRGATVEVSLQTDGTTCALSVVDHGPGVPAEARERIFERFFRVDVARSRAERTLTSGAGLGLSIGRRIAELHGGSLTVVDSRPGRTEFRATLPLATDPAGPYPRHS